MSTSPTDGSTLLPTLAKALEAIAVVMVGAAARRAGATVGGYAVVGVLFAVSLCFLTFAGYRALETASGSILAALVMGCAYLFLALIAALVLLARRR